MNKRKSNETIILEFTHTEFEILHHIVCSYDFTELNDHFDEDVCDQACGVDGKIYHAYRSYKTKSNKGAA
tara:strand:- start:1520 stop:1729 length:210 start_codon:yes stop_codon:yes gene_type:complete